MWANVYRPKRVFIGRLDYDRDLLEEIHLFCKENNIKTGYISVLGALKKATVGYYNQQEKKYETISINKNVEIVNCYGNISIKDGNPFAHIHLVLSDNKGETLAGHTMPGCIVFAGEVYIHEVDGPDCIREIDEITKLPLWKNL
ncbi:MAG: PPC domain-containing DNA-binding protein [Cyanobacteriota bacterium]